MQELFYIGLTHQSAPLAIREKLRAERERQVTMLSDLSSLGEGRMLLVTCERFEVYATTRQMVATRWLAVLARWFGLPAELLEVYTRTLSGPEAAEHLLRVAAGLESRIVGERQILGQVRNAFQCALEQQSLDAELSMLARTAIRTGKRVRHETLLGSSSRSIVTVAMEWLADKHAGLGGHAVGVVGSGRLAALVASEAAARHPRKLTIVGRNEARAAEIARRFNAQCAGMAALAQAVADADVVITCTASPSYLVNAALIGARRTIPLLLIDLSVPRNVDPAVSRLPGVTLGHLDEMVAQGLNHRAAPESDVIRQAERIVDQELRSFLQWQREREAAPAITELFRQERHASVDKRAMHDRIMRLKAEVAA